MELQNIKYNPNTFYTTLLRRDIDDVTTFERHCTRAAGGDELEYKICQIVAKNFSENKEKAESCTRGCKDIICSTDCVLSGTGFSYRAFLESPIVKAEIECATNQKSIRCLNRCNSILDTNCVKHCAEINEPDVISCLSSKINAPMYILEQRKSCMKEKCFIEDDLSKFQPCYEECTTGKKDDNNYVQGNLHWLPSL